MRSGGTLPWWKLRWVNNVPDHSGRLGWPSPKQSSSEQVIAATDREKSINWLHVTGKVSAEYHLETREFQRGRGWLGHPVLEGIGVSPL